MTNQPNQLAQVSPNNSFDAFLIWARGSESFRQAKRVWYIAGFLYIMAEAWKAIS